MQYATIAKAASLLVHVKGLQSKKAPSSHQRALLSPTLLLHCLTHLVCSWALIPCITTKGEDETLLYSMKLNQTLTLFFSNFQLSSWARICSTTDMASRPCLTYSFSWNKEGEEEIIISHDHVMEQSRAGCTCSSDWCSYLCSDSSASKTLLIQILLRACRHKFRDKINVCFK